MAVTATLSSEFRISIPAVRTAKQWKAGQEHAFIPKGTGVLFVPEREALAGVTEGITIDDYRDRRDRL